MHISEITMKTYTIIKYGEPEKAFELQEKPTPVPAANEILVAVDAFGINFADIMARNGLYQDAPPLPAVIGYESVGRVEACGSDVKNKLEKGTRVVAFSRFGGYASHVVSDERAVVPIGEDMDAGVACALAVQYSTAWFCAEEMIRLRKGNHVLIQAAAGGVGTALVQLCKRHGCIIYGTAGSDKKLEYLRELGVDYPINYNTSDFATEIKKLRPEGVDVAFDSVGGKTFRKSFNSLNKGGRIVGYGAAENLGGGLQIWDTLKMVFNFGIYHPVQFLMNSRGMIGVNMLRIAGNHPDWLKICLESVVDLVKKGEIKPTVGGVFSADKLADAHRFVESRKSMGKVIVKW